MHLHWTMSASGVNNLRSVSPGPLACAVCRLEAGRRPPSQWHISPETHISADICTRMVHKSSPSNWITLFSYYAALLGISFQFDFLHLSCQASICARFAYLFTAPSRRSIDSHFIDVHFARSFRPPPSRWNWIAMNAIQRHCWIDWTNVLFIASAIYPSLCTIKLGLVVSIGEQHCCRYLVILFMFGDIERKLFDMLVFFQPILATFFYCRKSTIRVSSREWVWLLRRVAHFLCIIVISTHTI